MMGFRRTWLAAALALAACGEKETRQETGPPAVDHDDPRAVARAALEAYRVKDLERLCALAVRRIRDECEQLLIQRRAHPRYRTLFSGWRFEAVRRWDGRLRDVRYLAAPEMPRQARVRFGEAREGRVPLVVLEREGDAWRFADVQTAVPRVFHELPER